MEDGREEKIQQTGLCRMKHISRHHDPLHQSLSKTVFTKQKGEQQKNSSGQFWLLCMEDFTGCHHLHVALEDSGWQKGLPT